MRFLIFGIFLVGALFSQAEQELVLPSEPRIATGTGEVWFSADGEVVRGVRADEKVADGWEPAWVIRERELSQNAGSRSRNNYHRSSGGSYPAWIYGYPSYGRGFYGGGYYGLPYYGGGCQFTPMPRVRFQAGYRKGGFSIYLNR